MRACSEWVIHVLVFREVTGSLFPHMQGVTGDHGAMIPPASGDPRREQVRCFRIFAPHAADGRAVQPIIAQPNPALPLPHEELQQDSVTAPQRPHWRVASRGQRRCGIPVRWLAYPGRT